MKIERQHSVYALIVSRFCWEVARKIRKRSPYSETPARLWFNVGLKSTNIKSTNITWDVDPMLVYCWATVVDGGPTIKQRWAIASCLLGTIYLGKTTEFQKHALRIQSVRLRAILIYPHYHLTTNLFNWMFHPFEVVLRSRDSHPSERKLFILYKMEVNDFEILLIDITFNL